MRYDKEELLAAARDLKYCTPRDSLIPGLAVKEIEKLTKQRRWSGVEDRLLIEMAGKLPAWKIAAILDRPKNGVHHRIRRLKKAGRIQGDAVLHGERHWNAKLRDVQAAMIGALFDAGFTTNEILEGWSRRPLAIGKRTIDEIAGCRLHRRRTT